MTEREMEDLLAQFPDDFFPGRGFKLIGRQQSMRGVGLFDLLFQDNRSRHWLIELKAVPLKITDIDQVMRYFEELCALHPEDNYVPCFVAPNIPRPVRLSLDGQGVEYQEIHLAEFLRISRERGIEPSSAAQTDVPGTTATKLALPAIDAPMHIANGSAVPNTKQESPFLLDKAYPFATVHGIGKEAEDIQKMTFPWKGHSWGRGSAVRRWHMTQLFREKGVLEQFYQQHWPRGITDGEREERHNLGVKELWDRMQSQ
ncbi:MAG TPA: endonuclease NucS domain-containing protein [Dehalococcoidia bacterium]|nr:endonuclease NucS domain-containing protein [Dehalococcoidia bacterium]